MTTTTSNQVTEAQWDAANKFLGKLLVDSTLSQGYLDICQKANGQDNAPELLNNWLTSQNYDTTPELVYAALIALQNTSLAYWLGVYGQSFFQDSQGNTSAAPVLKIIPDAQGNAVPYINGIALKKYIFKSVVTNNIPNPTLTWDLDSNSTAGNIIFYYTSPITPESSPPPTGYTGNWFQGTLQTSATTSPKTYYAGLSQPTTPEATPVQTQENFIFDPTNTSFWSGDNWLIITAYFSVILTITALGLLIYKKRKVSTKQIDDLQIQENARPKVLENQQNQQGEVNNPEIVNSEPEIVNQEIDGNLGDFYRQFVDGMYEPKLPPIYLKRHDYGEGLLGKDVLEQGLVESITFTSEENSLDQGQNFGNLIDQPAPPSNLESIFVESEIYNPEPLNDSQPNDSQPNDSQPNSTDSKKEQEPEQPQKVKKKSPPQPNPLAQREETGQVSTTNIGSTPTPNSNVQSRVVNAPKPSDDEYPPSQQPYQPEKPSEDPKSKDDPESHKPEIREGEFE